MALRGWMTYQGSLPTDQCSQRRHQSAWVVSLQTLIKLRLPHQAERWNDHAPPQTRRDTSSSFLTVA